MDDLLFFTDEDLYANYEGDVIFLFLTDLQEEFYSLFVKKGKKIPLCIGDNGRVEYTDRIIQAEWDEHGKLWDDYPAPVWHSFPYSFHELSFEHQLIIIDALDDDVPQAIRNEPYHQALIPIYHTLMNCLYREEWE